MRQFKYPRSKLYKIKTNDKYFQILLNTTMYINKAFKLLLDALC